MITICSKRIVNKKFYTLILSTFGLALYLVLGPEILRYITLFKYSAPVAQSSSFEKNQKIETILQQINTTKEEAIFPANQIGNYLLLNPNICKDTPRVHIIVIVNTATTNFQRRHRIRKTFTNSSLLLPFQIRTAFLLGKSIHTWLQDKMELEHAQFKDTVMGDFIDDYHNLTLKGTMGFRWISEYCPNSDIVLKIDDDVIIDMYRLLEIYIDYMKGKQKSMFCMIWKNNIVQRNGKWKLPPNFFRNLTVYPYYHCNGFTLLITSDLAASLYQVAKVTPFFWIDDIYLYGMLPKVLGGVTFHSFGLRKYMSWGGKRFFYCLKTHGRQCPMFSALLMKRDDFNTFWRTIQDVHSNEALREREAQTFRPVELLTIS